MVMEIRAIIMDIIIEEEEGTTQEGEEDTEIITMEEIIVTIIIITRITIVALITQEAMTFGEDNTNECIKVINM